MKYPGILHRLPVVWLAAAPLLGGCAGRLPGPDPEHAWVALQEAPGTTLLAEQLDGKHLADGRFFKVPAGEHQLTASLYIAGIGDNNGQICRAQLKYAAFMAGGHYTLAESSLGEDYTLTLYEDPDKKLTDTPVLDCLPG